MPAGSRAYAVGLLAMTSALGVGVAVLALPVADLGIWGWRILFGVALAGTPAALRIGRRLPESRRFQVRSAARVSAPPRASRLRLLGAALFLFNLFVVPASQFQNEYLRHERHYSAAHISLFTIVTVVPGALGIVAGGRLADTKGRRRVGAVAAAGSAVAAVLLYATSGPAMWLFSTVAAIIGAAVIPALSVYGPELFPTTSRGFANGLLNVIGRGGSVLGLIAVGVMASAFGRFWPAFAVVAAGPLGLAALVLVAFPETAGRELEDINPEDRGSNETDVQNP
jgi:MFS family permease